ncbi:MAG TPA: HypC/HybG/HupF family hydrogenase formation chaperone [Aestuariivirga sp.]|nr:HypC/HybG/HupF family hydrogenase formation chaperone [Aestuariivirga sp.]
MCLAIPAQVLSLEEDGQNGVVMLGGIRKRISMALVDDVKAGDYVLVHVGYALSSLSEEEAMETLAMMREAGIVAETARP